MKRLLSKKHVRTACAGTAVLLTLAFACQAYAGEVNTTAQTGVILPERAEEVIRRPDMQEETVAAEYQFNPASGELRITGRGMNEKLLPLADFENERMREPLLATVSDSYGFTPIAFASCPGILSGEIKSVFIEEHQHDCTYEFQVKNGVLAGCYEEYTYFFDENNPSDREVGDLLHYTYNYDGDGNLLEVTKEHVYEPDEETYLDYSDTGSIQFFYENGVMTNAVVLWDMADFREGPGAVGRDEKGRIDSFSSGGVDGLLTLLEYDEQDRLTFMISYPAQRPVTEENECGRIHLVYDGNGRIASWSGREWNTEKEAEFYYQDSSS